MTGTIVTVKERGFGFIRTEHHNDVFFHCSALQGGLVFSEQLVELRVQFELRQSDRGPQAIDIRPAP